MKKITAWILTAIMLLTAFAGCTKRGSGPDATAGPEDKPDETHGVVSLRVNYETEPNCVDGAPVFSWAVNSAIRGTLQDSYVIKVARSEAELESGTLVWDSGKVSSRENVCVQYGGAPESLLPATRYYWKVAVETNKGETLTSGTESFITALGDNGFDTAQWIIAGGKSGADVERANWIWLLSGDSQGSVPVKTEYFRKTLELGKTVRSAVIAYAADDYGELYVNGENVIATVESDGWEHGVFADITELLHGGKNVLAARVVNKQEGYGALLIKLVIEYTDGTKETVLSDKSWIATDKNPGKAWYAADASEASYKAVNSAVKYGNAPWNSNVTLTDKNASAPLLRRDFEVGGKIRGAFMYASAAGLYQLYVNGVRPDETVLNPGRSEYTERVMYQCFDITHLLKEGGNTLGAMLGRGWYIGAASPYGGVYPAFIGKLVIEYDDGRRETIVTDGEWRVSEQGPVLSDDIFDGETYDARRELTGWSENGFDASGWQPAAVTDAKKLGIGEPVPQLSGSVRVMDRVAAQSVTEIAKNTYIYDFGQNLAGVVSVKLKGEAGTEVTLRHAEMLNDGNKGSDGPKGTLYTANLRSAKATDRYIMKGAPEGETYTPTFTFHGFRYVEISGLGTAPELSDVTALVVYSGLEDTGRLTTSDALLNQLISNTYWGQRGNFLSTPTDCPQRDERMGWSGDAQIFCGTSAYNMNVKTFFDKYITDLNDCQRDNGAYPDVAPATWRQYYTGAGNNAWGDAGVIIPWIMYQRYGDSSYIEKNYSNMKRYGSYLVSTSQNYIRSVSAYGDWLSIGESTEVGVTDTAYCIRVFDILEQMALLLGKDKDAQRFANHAAKYREAWIAKYVRSETKLRNETQTAYLVALAFDILPEEQRQAMADRLNERIVKRGNKLTTGFIGCSLLLPVLCRFGHEDTAFSLLQQEEYPSWKYPVLQGATTIWERWNSYTIADGFGDAAMNSFNHYSYGSVTEWLYDSLAGICCDEASPAFSHFILRPTAGGGITSAAGEYDSIRGLIKSSWEAADNAITKYSCTVPGNTTATLYLRAASADNVTEQGRSLAETEGVEIAGFENGVLTLTLGSGDYTFEIG